MSKDIRRSCGKTLKNDIAQINKHTEFDEIQMSIGGRSNESSLCGDTPMAGFFTLGVACVRKSMRTRYMGHGGSHFIHLHNLDWNVLLSLVMPNES